MARQKGFQGLTEKEQEKIKNRLLKATKGKGTIREVCDEVAGEFGFESGQSLQRQLPGDIRREIKSKLYVPRASTKGGVGSPGTGTPRFKFKEEELSWIPERLPDILSAVSDEGEEHTQDLVSKFYREIAEAAKNYESDSEWGAYLVHRKEKFAVPLRDVDNDASSEASDFVKQLGLDPNRIAYWRLLLIWMKYRGIAFDTVKTYIPTWFRKMLDTRIDEHRMVELVKADEVLGDWLTRDEKKLNALRLLKEYGLTDDDINELIEGRGNGQSGRAGENAGGLGESTGAEGEREHPDQSEGDQGET